VKPVLKLHNTLGRKIQEFKPLKKNSVSLYTCGPTVYNYAHIGNLRTYIFEDILERVLMRNGYRVDRVMNITDVGHLTGDTDAGEDKVEKEARSENRSVKEITEFYTEKFLEDLRELNVKIPRSLPKATSFIEEQIELVEELMKKGYAYETAEAVYFDVKKFKSYGKLSGQKLEEKTVAARAEVVADKEKRSPADFALWFKTVGRFKDHIQRWPSPWGEGFPGWHLECSAIARALLGQPLDIHTGGVDHIGTHHENEIAQSEAAYKLPLANYWLHGEFLLIDAAKMAKSEKNFITLADLKARGYAPLSFRYLVLNSHYRSKLNFSWEALSAAEHGLYKIEEAYFALGRGPIKLKGPLSRGAEIEEIAFTKAINEDLNTPKALAVLHKVLRAPKIPAMEKRALIEKMNQILQIIGDEPPGPSSIPRRVQELAAQRLRLRNNKQFKQADVLRDEIDGLGYTIIDEEGGYRLVPKRK